MNSKQIVSLVGSVILLIGCFMPIANNFIDSNVGYMFSPDAFAGGVALVVMAALGIYGAFRENTVFLLVGTCLGALVFVATLLTVSGVLGETEDFAELSLSSISFKYGSGVIMAGLLIMLGSSLMVRPVTAKHTVKKRRSSRSSKSNLTNDNIHRAGLTRARNLPGTSKRRSSSGSIYNTRPGSKHRSRSKRRSAPGLSGTKTYQGTSD